MSDELQPTVGANTGSPDAAPGTGPTQTPVQNSLQSPDSLVPETPGSKPPSKSYTQDDFDRFVKKQDAEFRRDFGADRRTTRDFIKAARENPEAVARALAPHLFGGQAQQPQQQPNPFAAEFAQTQQAVEGLMLNQQISDLKAKFPRLKRDENALVEVLQEAYDNRVDLEMAYYRKYYESDLTDRDKEVADRIRRKQSVFIEGGSGANEEVEELEISPFEARFAQHLVKNGEVKSMTDYAKKRASQQKKG